MTLQTAVPMPGFAGTEEGYTPLQSMIARTGVRKGARRLGWRVFLVRWTTTRPTPAGKARQSWVSEVRALAGTDRARLSRGAFPTLLSSP